MRVKLLNFRGVMTFFIWSEISENDKICSGYVAKVIL